MEITKTVGFFTSDNGQKSFKIHRSDGQVFDAIRDGSSSKFKVLGYPAMKLADCKRIVLSEGEEFDSGEDSSASEGTPPLTTVGAGLCDNPSAWDCVDPCALLIRLCGMQLSHDNELRRTLDAYGWMKPDGTPDFEGADNNYERKKRC